MTTETYTLTLRPLPSPVPAEARLKRALKCLLRVYGLRCLAVQEQVAEDVPVPSAGLPCSERGGAGAGDCTPERQASL